MALCLRNLKRSGFIVQSSRLLCTSPKDSATKEKENEKHDEKGSKRVDFCLKNPGLAAVCGVGGIQLGRLGLQYLKHSAMGDDLKAFMLAHFPSQIISYLKENYYFLLPGIIFTFALDPVIQDAVRKQYEEAKVKVHFAYLSILNKSEKYKQKSMDVLKVIRESQGSDAFYVSALRLYLKRYAHQVKVDRFLDAIFGSKVVRVNQVLVSGEPVEYYYIVFAIGKLMNKGNLNIYVNEKFIVVMNYQGKILNVPTDVAFLPYNPEDVSAQIEGYTLKVYFPLSMVMRKRHTFKVNIV